MTNGPLDQGKFSWKNWRGQRSNSQSEARTETADRLAFGRPKVQIELAGEQKGGRKEGEIKENISIKIENGKLKPNTSRRRRVNGDQEKRRATQAEGINAGLDRRNIICLQAKYPLTSRG